MQSLKTLGLVEGIAGPKGGYRATAATYEALSIDKSGDEVVVPVVRNGVAFEGVTASEIVFDKVMHLME
jgi:predicted transcriptional regulator